MHADKENVPPSSGQPRQSLIPQPTLFKPDARMEEGLDFAKIIALFNSDSQLALKTLKSQQAAQQKAIKDVKQLLEL